VHVSGTTRSAERASALQSLGFDVFACHGDDEEHSSVFSKNATIGGGVGEDEYDGFVSERLQYATCLMLLLVRVRVERIRSCFNMAKICLLRSICSALAISRAQARTGSMVETGCPKTPLLSPQVRKVSLG
jgi:hypothetical protein